MDSILSKHGASGKAGAVQPNKRVKYARFARPTGKSDALLPAAYAQRSARAHEMKKIFSQSYPTLAELARRGIHIDVNGGGYRLRIASLHDDDHLPIHVC